MGLMEYLSRHPRTMPNIQANVFGMHAAARNALKRKKQHEHLLEQTNGQINMLEQQIYSIESANINQETLAAMKNAGEAMKKIHGKMTMEDVDTTMYVICAEPSSSVLLCLYFLNSLYHPWIKED